jgi:hypothetical protein
MLISVLWLVVGGGHAVLNWPGEDYTKGFWPQLLEAPDDWRDQHPECMDRYGFWPDGQRMERSEFKVVGGFGIWFRELVNGIAEDRGLRTPEQQARDKWADDIRSKVSACERPLWLPSAKQALVSEARIRTAGLVILPPLLLLLIGATLIEIWRHYVKPHWLKLPQHIRTGFLRLYGVVAVPWIAWFGYSLFDALQRHNDRLASSAFWWLLIVPIGAPIVLTAALWVMAGFRKREPVSTK